MITAGSVRDQKQISKDTTPRHGPIRHPGENRSGEGAAALFFTASQVGRPIDFIA